MTFLQLKQRLARRRGANDSSLVTATGTRYGNALNESHRAILRKPGMETLRQGIVTFASVADQQLYALPNEGIARINRIWETTNDRKLIYRPLSWLREVDPDPSSGTPSYWIPIGYQDVHTQPSDASEVFVDSTSASDTNTAYVEGIISGGYYRTASVTMTGTTAVSLSSSITTWIQITKFYLSAAAVGTVTLHEDASGGTELSRITIGKTRNQFYGFALQEIPSSAVTYTADVLRGIPDLSNDTDEPLLPEDFHDLLLDAAELRELRKSDDPTRYAIVTQSYRDGLRDLQTFMTSHPDWSPTFDAPQMEFSSLGPNYPAGT